jgi:hypothetical protein
MKLKCSLPCSQEPSNGPCPEPDESSPQSPHTISLRSILILSSHPFLGLFSILFPSDFSMKSSYTLVSGVSYMPCRSHPPWFYHSNNRWRGTQSMKLRVMQIPRESHHFLPLRSMCFKCSLSKFLSSIISLISGTKFHKILLLSIYMFSF